MKGMDWMFRRRKQEESGKGVHPNFRIKSGEYYTNRAWEITEGPIVAKVGFKFDDPALLNGCPFIAKFGINFGDGPKYFGLAYAHHDEEQSLIDWSQRFPYVRLMKPLTRTGELVNETQTFAIKG